MNRSTRSSVAYSASSNSPATLPVNRLPADETDCLIRPGNDGSGKRQGEPAARGALYVASVVLNEPRAQRVLQADDLPAERELSETERGLAIPQKL